MNIKIYTCNSFALTERGGNPAGIALKATELADKKYIEIAKTLGFSETAFVFNSQEADFKVRFFTPVEEVDLCGHATIATFHTLFQTGQISAGQYTMATKAGILTIDVSENGNIFMQQPLPKFYEILNKSEVADSLNIPPEKLTTPPVQIVSTGLKDIIVPIKSPEMLNEISPDFAKISKISQQANAVGYHLFSFDNDQIYTRNFAPLLGINEESATGTASGALAGYLFQYNLVDRSAQINLKFLQGFRMEKESQIDVILKIRDNHFIGLKVGGSCKNLQEQQLLI